jgi:hypothetical protein
MKTASAIVEELLGVLRRQFYGKRDEQRWYFERELLVRALTHPAWVLEQRGAELPTERYQAIVQGIIRTIQEHGAAGEARNFGRYFLTCVQSHMSIHWADHPLGGILRIGESAAHSGGEGDAPRKGRRAARGFAGGCARRGAQGAAGAEGRPTQVVERASRRGDSEGAFLSDARLLHSSFRPPAG